MKQWLYIGGIAAIAIGTALVYAAVLMAGAFMPGVILIVIGIVSCGAGAIMEVVRPDARDAHA